MTRARPTRPLPVPPIAAGLLLVSGAACAGGHAGPSVSYTEVRAVVDRHCLSCHSERPTEPAFPIAPNGMAFDTAEELRRHAAGVKERTLDGTMPLLNKTGMTGEERDLLARWVDNGARVP